MSVVSYRLVARFDETLRVRGLDLEAALRGAVVSRSEILASPWKRMPWEEFLAFLVELEEMLGGAEAVAQVTSEFCRLELGLLSSLGSYYSRPYMLYQIGCRIIGPSLFRGLSARIETRPNGVVEHLRIPDDFAPTPEIFHWHNVGAMRVAPTLLGCPPAQVEFDFDSHSAEYRIAFSDRASGDDECEALSDELEANAPDLEALLHLQLEPLSAEGVPAGMGPVSDRLRSVLREGDLAAAGVAAGAARRMGMSERTLARRLRSEGCSYTQVRDEVRLDLSVELIREGQPVDSIYSRVGFADPSSFRRAFRRWTGMPPGQFESQGDSFDASKRA